MPINSRAKGARLERELASKLRSLGFKARRGRQYSGSPFSPDVVSNVKAIHWECKGVEKGLNLEEVLFKAAREAPDGNFPCIAHKKNGEEWKVTLFLEDFFNLLKLYNADYYTDKYQE